MGLLGKRILITRPEPMASALAVELNKVGAISCVFPVVQLDSASFHDSFLSILKRLASFDWLIFNSPSTVYQVFSMLPANFKWPKNVQIAAIGEGTANVLKEGGLNVLAVPKQFSSEALLALPEFKKIANKQVLILRGEGGREILAPGFMAMGAQVSDVIVYRRCLPKLTLDQRQLFLKWQQAGFDAIVVSSQALLHHLIALLGPEQLAWLKQQTLLVCSQKQYENAMSLGIKKLIVAMDANHETIIAKLEEGL